MSAVDSLRDALFGSPPSPTTKPSREGVLAAFTQLYDAAVIAQYAAQSNITIVPDLAARDTFFATEANRGKLLYVNNNGGSASDPANGVYEYVGGPRLAQGFYDAITASLDPQFDALSTQIDLLKRAGSIYPWRAPYMERNILRFPRFLQRLTSGYADRAPASGVWYELDLPADYESGNYLIYYDAATNALVPANIYALPGGLGGDGRPVIGQFAGGNFTGVGELAELIASDFDANVSQRPSEIGAGTSSYNTSSIAELAALGIYQGWTGTGSIAVGGKFANGAAPFIFARVFVRVMDGGALVAPAFETYNADHVQDPSTGLTFRGGGALEKQYSPTLASYLISVKERPGGAIGLRATVNSAGRQLVLAGLQFAATTDPSAVVPVALMTGTAPDPRGMGAMYLPTELAFMEDRPFSLYPTQMVDRRPFGGALTTVAATTTNSRVLPFIGTEAVRVDPTRITDGDVLAVSRAFEDATLRQFQTVAARKVPAAAMAGKTFGLLFMGDSKVDDFDTAAGIETMLEGYGATVTRTGTLNGGGFGNFHEGRSGKSIADFIGKRVDRMVFTTPANYIAAPNFPNRYDLNPFLFAGSGTGSFNGRIFDYVKYLAAYSSLLAAHDIVVIDLGTNDLQDFTSAADLTDFADLAYTRMIGSIRDAGKKVIVAPVGGGWHGSINELQRRGGYALLRGVMRSVKRFNDSALVRVAGAWAQMDPYAFGGVAAQSIDPDTGVATGSLSDPTHPKGSVRMQNIECVAAHIAHMMRL